MMSINEELKELLEKHLGNRLLVTERERLTLLLQQPDNQLIFSEMIEAVLHEHRFHELSAPDKQALFDTVLQKAEEIRPEADLPFISFNTRVMAIRKRLAYAAAFIILLGAGAWFLINRNTPATKVAAVTAASSPVVAPSAQNKVLLTLADGSQVALDDVKGGITSGQKGVNIVKTGNGGIAYEYAGVPSGALAYNTITTPKGGQYHIVLPDNTEVWLNAASSLKFPVAFTGSSRTVELTGEGYFEVTSGTARPFVVMVNDMKVNVLGTHFNIMAYEDESIVKTTLLEGSVKLTRKGSQIMLKPGQQGSLPQNSSDFSLTHPNIDQVMAWKNGEFRFEDTKVETIMHQISRWYDLTVVYEGNISDIALSGIISRKEKVSQLLEILEATRRVHFRIENDKIIVMPYRMK